MISGNLFADPDQVLGADAKLGDFPLRFDLCDGEVAAHRLRDILGLRRAGAELDGGIAVLLAGALSDNLHIFHLEDRDGHLPAIVHE